ncbi:hypothetical protein CV102_07395 [Natronococcus pandeyae]|uniref:Uncharacterized protein n=1 Tax=Natronococcus pandeyae TaxID=2055836 RepID=A0A8J8Q5L3_9EURY|nr:hypothetical protein CV102_07395 [Natronococcus pandeyae]
MNGSSTDNTDDEATTETDTAADAPGFEIDEDAPGEFILLRNQPQEPSGITVGDEFEIAVVLGNAGGESITGEVSVELVPPNEDEDIQTATIVVEGGDEIPSGAARFFTTGLFEATVAGNWELIAGTEIGQVHQAYDPIVTVEKRPDD